MTVPRTSINNFIVALASYKHWSPRSFSPNSLVIPCMQANALRFGYASRCFEINRSIKELWLFSSISRCSYKSIDFVTCAYSPPKISLNPFWTPNNINFCKNFCFELYKIVVWLPISIKQPWHSTSMGQSWTNSRQLYNLETICLLPELLGERLHLFLHVHNTDSRSSQIQVTKYDLFYVKL